MRNLHTFSLSDSEPEPPSYLSRAILDHMNSNRLLESINQNGLEPSEHLSALAKLALKELLSESEGSLSGSTVIYTDGFDAEQIWCQLEANVEVGLKHAKRLLQKSRQVEYLVPVDVEEALDGT